MAEREIRATEFPVPFPPVSVEVWLREDGKGIRVSVMTDGVNDLVTADCLWDDLYAEIDITGQYESNEKHKKESARLGVAQRKRVLKQMTKFIQSKGYK